jgi:hypothetical protein
MSRLLIVSNRLPISVTKNKDKLQFEPSTGVLPPPQELSTNLNPASGQYSRLVH